MRTVTEHKGCLSGKYPIDRTANASSNLCARTGHYTSTSNPRKIAIVADKEKPASRKSAGVW